MERKSLPLPPPPAMNYLISIRNSFGTHSNTREGIGAGHVKLQAETIIASSGGSLVNDGGPSKTSLLVGQLVEDAAVVTGAARSSGSSG